MDGAPKPLGADLSPMRFAALIHRLGVPGHTFSFVCPDSRCREESKGAFTAELHSLDGEGVPAKTFTEGQAAWACVRCARHGGPVEFVEAWLQMDRPGAEMERVEAERRLEELVAAAPADRQPEEPKP